MASEPLARRPDGKVHFVRVVVTAAGGTGHGLAVRSSGGQGSHQLYAMAQADSLAVSPPGLDVVRGDTVNVLRLTP